MTIGCIGVGNRGVQVLNAFCAHKDAQVVALSDVYEPYLQGQYDRIDPHFKDLGKRVPTRQPDFGGPVERVKDFRRLLDRKDIDAVIVATPDHWHAIQVIDGLRRGQGRLRREAALRDRARGPADGRGGAEARPRRAGRPPAAVVGAVREARRAGALRRRSARSPGRGPATRATCPPTGSASRPTPTRPRASTGTSGSALGRRGRSTRTSCRTSSAGGTSTPRRWPTGACITSTPCAGWSASGAGVALGPRRASSP